MRAPAASVVLFLALGACSRPAAPPVSVLLVTLDTTNRDALGCYGQELPLTPVLDRLASEGLVFDQARTVAPLTLPAHASMMTGLAPLRHGVRDNALRPLTAEAECVAEVFAAAGWQTAAFVSAVVLSEPYGLGQGFEVYDAPRGSAGGVTAHMLERPARETFAAAREWLRARDPGRPFFLWVHGFEPHEPYVPAPEYLRLAGGDPYLGEVAALDAAVGELLAELEDDPGPERLLILAVADHGESLGEHGERTHSVLCHERVLRVPLIVRLPGRARAGTRSEAPVSVTDVAPTVLAAAGLAVPPGLDGIDLLGATPGRTTTFESYTGYLNYGWSPLAGCTDGATKYVHGTDPELYDLRADPGETRNLFVPGHPDVVRARETLSGLAARPRLMLEGLLTDGSLAADVAALGYADGAAAVADCPEPLAETGLPAPRTRMDELERFYLALLRHNKGNTRRAIEDLEAIVAENPLNGTALNVLGSYLMEAKQPERALEVLRRIPAQAAERVTVQDLLGHCLEQLGRMDEALVHFERALAAKPGDAHQERDVARVRSQVAR